MRSQGNGKARNRGRAQASLVAPWAHAVNQANLLVAYYAILGNGARHIAGTFQGWKGEHKR
jgi:hypothetical protein